MEESDEEREDERRKEECERVERQETVEKELKTLAQRVRKNSQIDWDAKNRNRPSDAPMLFGCPICNGDIEQPEAFADKENPGLCDECRELVCRLADK